MQILLLFNTLLIINSGYILHIYADCKSGYMRGNVDIISSEQNCTIMCDSVIVKKGVHSIERICFFQFHEKLVFSTKITNLTFRGQNALSFIVVGTNTILKIKYPIQIGGTMLEFAKERRHFGSLGGFHTSKKAMFNFEGIDSSIKFEIAIYLRFIKIKRFL